MFKNEPIPEGQKFKLRASNTVLPFVKAKTQNKTFIHLVRGEQAIEVSKSVAEPYFE